MNSFPFFFGFFNKFPKPKKKQTKAKKKTERTVGRDERAAAPPSERFTTATLHFFFLGKRIFFSFLSFFF